MTTNDPSPPSPSPSPQERGISTIAFRVGDLAPLLLMRGNPHATAKRDLGRYYDLLGRVLQQVAFSDPSVARAFVDVVAKGNWNVDTADVLWAKLGNVLEPTLGTDDTRGIIVRFRTLHVVEVLAMIDAAERFLLLPTQDDDGLRLVGLLR